MEFKDYYKILGVDTDADKAAIKKAYRKLARKYHPDVSTESDAEKQFKEVAEAYEVLGSDERRAEYDQLRQYGSRDGGFTPPPGWESTHGGFGSQGGDFSEFFNEIFGGGFGARHTSRQYAGGEDFYSQRGRDIEIDLPLLLEETLHEDTRTIAYRLPQSGGRAEDIKKTLKVTIPKGVMDGERIRLKSQGGPGYGDGPSGDLYLRVRLVPHPLFDVVGHDLSITLPVAPWEAALGAKVSVPTLSGKIKLSIAPGSQTGQKLRVKGKGLPHKSGQGNLLVILKVVMPDKIDKQSEALWAQLRDASHFDPRHNLEG